MFLFRSAVAGLSECVRVLASLLRCSRRYHCST